MIKILALQIDDSANAPSSICNAGILIIKSLYGYSNFSIRYLRQSRLTRNIHGFHPLSWIRTGVNIIC